MNNQKECQGEKCSAVNDVGHSPECQFEHFLSYTGFWSESAAVRDKLKLAFTDGVAAGQLNGKPVASNQSDELDDDHPLYLVNGQIEDLLEGFGASEDHEDVIKFLLDTGLPRSTVDRIHKAIVWGDTKVRPSEPTMLTQEAIDAIWEAQFNKYGQMCDADDWNMFATSIETASLCANGHEAKP
jgi:hypothetical protein